MHLIDHIVLFSNQDQTLDDNTANLINDWNGR